MAFDTMDIGFGPGVMFPGGDQTFYGTSMGALPAANQDIGFGAGNLWPSDSAVTGGSGLGSAKDWAAGLKDIAGGLKGVQMPGAGSPPVARQSQAAGVHQGTAGALDMLLQLIEQRANAYSQAARAGPQGRTAIGGGSTKGLLGI